MPQYYDFGGLCRVSKIIVHRLSRLEGCPSLTKGSDAYPPSPGRPVAPRKAVEKLYCSDEKQQGSCTALPRRKAARELHCPERKAARRWTGNTNEKTRTLVGEYCENSYRVVSLFDPVFSSQIPTGQPHPQSPPASPLEKRPALPR